MSLSEKLKQQLNEGGWMIVFFFIGLGLIVLCFLIQIDFFFLAALPCVPLVFSFLIIILRDLFDWIVPLFSEAPVFFSIVLIIILLVAYYKPFQDPEEDARYFVNENSTIIHKIDDCEYLPDEDNSKYYKSLDSAIRDENTLCDQCLGHLMK